MTLDEPEWVTPLPVLVTGEDDQADRSNVNVYGGYDTFGRSLVVFVDRFENIAFHSERGDQRFGWLF